MVDRERCAWLCCAALLAACRADPQREIIPATVFRPPQGGAAALWSPSASRELILFDADELPRDGETEWLASDTFELAFTGSTCEGTCPDFALTLDETGRLQFRTGVWSARPGSYDTEIPVARARTLYLDVITSGVLQMHDSYVDEADGCVTASDYETYTFELRSQVGRKRVTYYLGCYGELPELRTLATLGPYIQRATDLEHYVSPTPAPCTNEGAPFPQYEPAYVLHDESTRAVGILRFTREGQKQSWTISDCVGDDEIAHGDVLNQSSCESVLANHTDNAFAWPATSARKAGATISPSSQAATIADVTVRLFELDSEATQYGERGESCAP